ncbi:MAG: thiamine-phosphate kinase [Magnetococcales bacterium]|nr:thiamine-phosphate kinase [Magnetococcales bacterium]
MANDKTVSSVGEFGLIEHCFKNLGRSDIPGVGRGIGDDAAVLFVPRTQDLLATSDTLVEGVHFTRDADPRQLGWKALCVNLSDIAAMGGEPRWYLLSISLPPTTPLAWVEQLALGLAAAGEQYRVALVGGNTSATTGPIVLTISLFGVVGNGRPILRSGAEEGNRIFVSGTLGDSVLGLRRLTGVDRGACEKGMVDFLLDRHVRPMPRTELGMALVDAAVARSAVDVSDGLLADLGHVCAASGVGADIHLEKMPLSLAARQWLGDGDGDRWRVLLTGGEDYELLFTISPGALDQIPAIAEKVGVPLTEIGVITREKGVRVWNSGKPLVLSDAGFKHF